MNEPVMVNIGVQLLNVLSVSGLLISVALTYTGVSVWRFHQGHWRTIKVE